MNQSKLEDKELAGLLTDSLGGIWTQASRCIAGHASHDTTEAHSLMAEILKLLDSSLIWLRANMYFYSMMWQYIQC